MGISYCHSQDLMDIIDAESADKTFNVESTFKTTRISIGQSVETRKKGILEIQLLNKFWNTPAPRTQSFASDRMSVTLGLEYAFTDRLTFGINGTSWDGIFDTHVKYRLLQQQLNNAAAPISITLYQSAAYGSESRFPRAVYSGDPLYDTGSSESFSDRMAFTSQVLLARKISPNFSLQITPTYIHRNAVLDENDPQDQFAVGVGGRYKVGNHVSIVSEYYYQLNPLESVATYDAFALGVNWEVGDIILQFNLTNTRAVADYSFISQTRNNFNFNDGNLYFGFNATYVLHTKSNR